MFPYSSDNAVLLEIRIFSWSDVGNTNLYLSLWMKLSTFSYILEDFVLSFCHFSLCIQCLFPHSVKVTLSMYEF